MSLSNRLLSEEAKGNLKDPNKERMRALAIKNVDKDITRFSKKKRNELKCQNNQKQWQALLEPLEFGSNGKTDQNQGFACHLFKLTKSILTGHG